MPAYEYRHAVSFEETSFVGNVYFANYFRWQGRCREMFLRDHCPAVIDLLGRRDIAFITRSAQCEYTGDSGFLALDEVLVRMRLVKFRGGRMNLEFTYVNARSPDQVVATGAQEVFCKARRGETWYPEPFPADMIKALQGYADSPELKEALSDALTFLSGKAQ
jgi:enediyne biosynthesis thioesterase